MGLVPGAIPVSNCRRTSGSSSRLEQQFGMIARPGFGPNRQFKRRGIAHDRRFSRSGDPATGDFSDAKVIRKFGDVPDDLSAL
jgi:hypothetical protein